MADGINGPVKPVRAWGALLLGALCLLIAFALVAIGILIARQDRNTTNIAANTRSNSIIAHNACLRGNIARRQQINNYEVQKGILRASRDGNTGRRDAWRFYLDNVATPGQAVTGAPVVEFANRQIEANQAEIDTLSDEIVRMATIEEAYVAAQKSVSAFPDSPNIYKRAQINCNKQYPLP